MGKVFQSTKTYTHAQGLSCCFRQWRATSHCNMLHGYAIEVRIVFEGQLDERGWVQDFGGLKEVKKFLEDTFDHKTLVAADDPRLQLFQEMEAAGILSLNVMPNGVGCERFAEYIYDWLNKMRNNYAQVQSVEVREHAGNSAICHRELIPPVPLSEQLFG